MADNLPSMLSSGNRPDDGGDRTPRIAVPVRAPRNEQELQRCFELRWQVLRAPWGAPRGSECDELDPTAIHAAAWDARDEPLAVGRLHFNSPEEAQVRYMAVRETARGQGLGRAVLEYLEAAARQRGAASVVLNAREAVADFYRRLGYVAVGPGPTMFDSVAHVRMRKRPVAPSAG